MNTATTPLQKISAGDYRTQDGRYKVEHSHGYDTWCDDPHPMKVRLDQATDAEKRMLGAKVTMRRTKKGWVEYLTWQCPGNEEHTYSRWIVWDNETDNYATGTGPDGFDTFKEAKAFALGCVINNAPQGQKEDTTMSSTTISNDNAANLVESLQALFSVKVVESKTYKRLTVDGKTIGYLKARSVDVPTGKGQYASFAIQTKAQVRKAINAMKRAAK